MQAEETWRKIGLAAFHKATSRPWRISRHCSWFTHTPACSPIPHKRFSSVSHFPRFASCIPCFGSCPRSVHDRPLQRLKHSGHFVPSKYTVCNLIFHKVGSLQEADRQSLFPAVFSGKQAAYRYIRPGKSGLPVPENPLLPEILIPVQMRKAPAGCVFLHDGYRNGTIREFPHTVPRNPG